MTGSLNLRNITYIISNLVLEITSKYHFISTFYYLPRLVETISSLRHDKFINNAMSNYNRHGDNHVKRRDNFGFNQPKESDSNVPIKYLHSEKKRETATIKVNFNGEQEKKYVPIFKDGTDEEFLDTVQECKTLLVNYPTMLENDQQVEKLPTPF